ncbi:protein SSUH2 homolog [Pollicipes pollicipes]|uniref:protein SSUH2 homolog n=1 Tax=Pollicipes pollicipes TaxID=41117 RepID=UPI001884F330|nr:protein SSUH2 homolog [Pollicipes pollicipes]
MSGIPVPNLGPPYPGPAGSSYPPPAGGHYPQQPPQYTPQPQYAPQPQHVPHGPQYPPAPVKQEVYPVGATQGPTAPPAGSFEKVEGYRDTGFNGGFVAPPSRAVPTAPPPDLPRMDVVQQPLSRGEVKEALAAFVAQHCCYGSGPIKDMEIRSVVPSATFKYTLDTFTEKRETKWKFEPWKGDSLATSGAPPPGPWDMPITPKHLFQKETRTLEVPNSQSLRPCHDCQAHGDKRCQHCAGRGRSSCGPCGASGVRQQEQCGRCGGTGTNECTPCHGSGMITCPTCRGERNLKYFVELTATWEVHSDKYVVATPGLPDEQVREVSGETVCQAQGLFVWPFTGFPEDQVEHASQHLVKKHQTSWPLARLLQQRHDVQQIPIHTVGYRYKETEGTFFVCGHEKKVFFPDYPARCCCCCVLL